MISPRCSAPGMSLAFRSLAASIRIAPAIKEYIVDLVRATRDPAAVRITPGAVARARRQPRATIALVRAARGQALLAGRDYVTPHDVKSLARDIMRHRIMLSFEADAEGLTPDESCSASSTISRCRDGMRERS